MERTQEMSPHFPIIMKSYKVFDQYVDNLANHFCYLVNNLM
jgi:hypothetical protein